MHNCEIPYSKEVLEKMARDPGGHGFPKSFEDMVLEHGVTTKMSGSYWEVALNGSRGFGGKSGRYEVGTDLVGGVLTITHRVFRSGRSVL